MTNQANITATHWNMVGWMQALNFSRDTHCFSSGFPDKLYSFNLYLTRWKVLYLSWIETSKFLENNWRDLYSCAFVYKFWLETEMFSYKAVWIQTKRKIQDSIQTPFSKLCPDQWLFTVWISQRYYFGRNFWNIKTFLSLFGLRFMNPLLEIHGQSRKKLQDLLN